MTWYFPWHPSLWFIIYNWERFTDQTDNPSQQKINTLVKSSVEVRCTWKGRRIHLQALLASCSFPRIQTDDREGWGCQSTFPGSTSQSPWGVGPARPALPSWGSRDQPFVLYHRRSNEGTDVGVLVLWICGVQIRECPGPLTPSCSCGSLGSSPVSPQQGTRPSLSRQVHVGSPCHPAHSC